jgi:hypothetical protein
VRGPWSLQYGSGAPLGIWFATLLVFGSLPAATDHLRTIANQSFYAWRVVDGDGKRIVEIHPGVAGVA